jgi:hypothetical protein
MSIKQNGGVFGRNPTFNDVTIEGQLTFDGDIDINSDLTVDGTIKADSVLVDTATNNYTGTPLAVGDNTKSQSGLNIQTSPTGYGYVLFGDGAGASSYIGQINYNHSNDKMTLKTAGNDRAVIDANGINVTGNVIIGTSGKGIDFSATAGTGTSELLDDYEEGTWTGTFSDGTNDATMSASFTTGQYVKIGSMVMVSGYFVNTSIGSMSGAVRITGLPFPSGNANSYSAGGGCAYGASLAITANQSISTYLAKNTDYINLMLWDGTAGASTLQASELSDGGQIVFSLTYIAA